MIRSRIVVVGIVGTCAACGASTPSPASTTSSTQKPTPEIAAVTPIDPTLNDAPADDCAPDGDVRFESIVIPGFPPATMRRRIEGHCATLTMSEGDRVGVFRARLDDADVHAIVDATPSSIDMKGMVPDMPVYAVDLHTPTRDVHLTIPLSPPTSQGAALTNLLNVLDQKLLRRPFQTVRATLTFDAPKAKVPGVAHVALFDDGTVPLDARIEAIHVMAAPDKTDASGAGAAILIDIGASGSTQVHVDAGGSANVDVPIVFDAAHRWIAVARVSLAFDIDAAHAVAPDGTKTIRSVVTARNLSVVVSP
jgi:hypothetical protein